MEVNTTTKGLVHEAPKSKTEEWYTPKYIFDALNLKFDLDPCSPGKDICHWIPAETHYTQIQDGLSRSWDGSVWLNPPYGRYMLEWLSKFVKHGKGIALVFSRTETAWFHKFATKADAICFLDKKIHFIRSDNMCKGGSPGCGSILIAFGKREVEALKQSGLGWIV